MHLQLLKIRQPIRYGSCNNLDADFGSWILRHCIAPPGFNRGCMRWLGGDQYTGSGYLRNWIHTSPCKQWAMYKRDTACVYTKSWMRSAMDVGSNLCHFRGKWWCSAWSCMGSNLWRLGVHCGVVQWSWVRIFVFLGVNGVRVVHGRGFESLTF
jgi:hypothetical protein